METLTHSAEQGTLPPRVPLPLKVLISESSALNAESGPMIAPVNSPDSLFFYISPLPNPTW